MKPLPTPHAWRSEAFAEDLDRTPAPSAGARRRRSWLGIVLGLLPVAIAAAGAWMYTIGNA